MVYFSKEEFENVFSLTISKIESVKIEKSDSYDEEKILETIKKIGMEEVVFVAIQLATVGYGNKKFGKYHYKGVTKDVMEFFVANSVKWDSVTDAKIGEGILTPGRILRFCRHYVHAFYEHSGEGNYLFTKYCPTKDPKFKSRVFRGSEYWVDSNDKETAAIILLTYRNLDSKLGTNMEDRIWRVFLARGFNNTFLETIQ